MDGKTGNDGKIVLTMRERDCLTLVAKGRTSKDVGRELGISAGGANFHILNAQRKLGALNRIHAVAMAIALGLLSATAAMNGTCSPGTSGRDDGDDD